MKILLVSYKYSPYPFVGANRWTSFSKHLAALNHEVHVITAPWNLIYNPPFDEEFENISIYHTAPHLFFFIRYSFQRIGILRYLAITFFKYIIDPIFCPMDEAQLWEGPLHRLLLSLSSRNSYDYIIVTGHPFEANLFISRFQYLFPSSRVVHDFRDPWFQHLIGLSPRKLAAYTSSLSSIFSSGDLFLYATPGLMKLYQSSIPNALGKKHSVLLNAADSSLFHDFHFKCSFTYDFVYTGTVSGGREETLFFFLDHFLRHKPQRRLLYIGYANHRVVSALSTLPNVDYLPHIDKKDLARYINSSRYALHLNGKHVPFALSTKIFEYASLGVATVSLNYGGDIDSIITSYSIGLSCDLTSYCDPSLLRTFPEYLEDCLNRLPPRFKPQTSHSFTQRTSELLAILSSI